MIEGNISYFFQIFIQLLIGVVILGHMLNFGEREIMKAWGLNKILQEEMIQVL
jgi:hypothetical protein